MVQNVEYKFYKVKETFTGLSQKTCSADFWKTKTLDRRKRNRILKTKTER